MPHSIGGLQGPTALPFLCLTFMTNKLPGTAAGRTSRTPIHTHRQLGATKRFLHLLHTRGSRPADPLAASQYGSNEASGLPL
jgi:hypothetical protein